MDDASMLAPGRCQVETWWTSAPGTSTAAHVGPGCRFGPVEWSVNVDRFWSPTTSSSTLGPQLKWAASPVIDRLSVGIIAAVDLRAQGDARTTRTIYLPLTWMPYRSLAVNANIGADWVGGNGRTRRLGLSGEWSASDRATVIAERFGANGEWVSRLRLRVALGAFLSLDVSAARTGPQATKLFAIGLNHDFAR